MQHGAKQGRHGQVTRFDPLIKHSPPSTTKASTHLKPTHQRTLIKKFLNLFYPKPSTLNKTWAAGKVDTAMKLKSCSSSSRT
jgi:hypothetical protein